MVQHPGPRLRHLRTLLTEPHHLFRRRYLPCAFRGRAGNVPRHRHGQLDADVYGDNSPPRGFRARTDYLRGPCRSGPASASGTAVRSNSTLPAASPPSVTASTSCPPNSHRERTAPPTQTTHASVYRENSRLVASGPGRITFEVMPEWPSIRVRDCGTFELHTPSRLASFGNGVYLVPSEIAPGTYRADNTASRCDVYRDHVHRVTSGPGRVAFEVRAEWSSIRVRELRNLRSPHSPSRLASFGDGVYLVPSEIAPGTYRADRHRQPVRCLPRPRPQGDLWTRTRRLRGAGAEWSSIRVRKCGTFEVHTHPAASPLSATASTSCLPRSRQERTAPTTPAAGAMSTATTSTG